MFTKPRLFTLVQRRLTTSASSQSQASAGIGRKLFWTAAGVAGVFGGLVLFDTRAAAHRHITMPLMHLLDAEEAHVLSIKMAKMGLAPKEWVNPDDAGLLETEVWGIKLNNPIGLAAGYDKHAEAIDSLLDFGFGLVEIGSVTPVPQSGNPKPRMFRLKEDNSVINRYGFNSEGHDTVAGRLSHRIRTWLFKNSVATKSGELVPSGVPRSLVLNKALGVNLGKNKVSAAEDNSDYVKGVSSLGQFADYIVVNISSPNTPGLRSLQRREPMLKLMKEVKEARDVHVAHRPPILVKIAPDVNEVELEDIAAVVQEAEMDGVIISNTTISRPSYLKSDPTLVSQIGGLSGPPVFPLAVEKVRAFYALTNGKIPIIGCGGVSSAEEAIAYAKAGASLVQLYTSLGYYGPGVVYDVKKGLVDYLKKEKTTWKELVGSDHQK